MEEITNITIKKIDEETYELEMIGEDDSIGNLLATYLESMDEVQLSYYNKPHPLENKIIVYVKLKKEQDIAKVVEKAVNKILEDLEDFRNKYIKALKKIGVRLEQ